MSGLDVAAGAVGIASLGIQVCQGLIAYYDTWKDYSSDVRDAYEAIVDLSRTLTLIKDSLQNHELDKERAKRVKTCLESCEHALVELNEKLQKLQTHTGQDGLRQKLLSKGQQMKYPFKYKTLEKLQRKVVNIQERLSLALQALQLNSIIHTEASVAQLINQQTDQTQKRANDREERVNEVLQQLYDKAYDYQNAKKRNDEPVEGTCRWFVSNKLFQDWVAPENAQSLTSPFLYVTADPGCGKSVLSRHLIDSILPQEGRTVCYSFFKDDFEDQKGSLQAISAMLHQLFISNRYLLVENKIVLDKFDTHGPKLFDSYTELWETFILATTLCHDQIVCVIDALDECREADRTGFLRAIGAHRDPALRILFTSRPYEDIRREVLQLHKENLPLIHLQGDQGAHVQEIKDEISLFIKSRIDKVSNDVRLSSAEREIFELQLGSIPNRNYLWVALVFNGLIGQQYITKKDIMNLSNDLPRGLPEAYEKILSRSRDLQRTKKVLHIILAANRPLTTSEMAVALAINGQESWADVADEIVPENRISDTIRDLCGLFVTIVDGKIYFLHQTAREFLTSESKNVMSEHSESMTGGGLVLILAHAYFLLLLLVEYIGAVFYRSSAVKTHTWLRSMDLTDSNTVLAEICISRLQQGHLRGDDSPFRWDQDRSMFEYAAENWTLHYRNSTNVFREEAAERAQRLLSGSLRDSFWTRAYSSSAYPIRGPPLCLASAFGLYEVVAMSLRSQDASDSLVDVTDDGKRSALSWATHYDHGDIVKLMIEQGANVNCSDSQWRTPLFWAVEKCRKSTDVVKLLIENGADADLVDKQGQTPLSMAVFEGRKDVIRLLVDNGADLNVPDSFNRTPLFWAAYLNDEQTASMLIEGGADIEFPDKEGQTPLLRAARKGHDRLVKLLIGRGADLDTRDNDGLTALFWATLRGHGEAARLLIQSGADVSLGDDRTSRTPLQSATYKCSIDVVRLLVEKDVQASVRHDENGRTELSWAAQHGQVNLAEVLIESGDKESIFLPDYDGRTALSWSASFGREDIVKLLIRYGTKASIDLPDKQGWTALSWAAANSHVDIVKLLIANGAKVSINDCDKHGRTPLSWAAAVGQESAVRLLLDLGAGQSINLLDENGWTAHHWASWHNHYGIVRLLFEYRASMSLIEDVEEMLLLAAAQGHQETVEVLIDKDTKTDALHRSGRTALRVAARHGHEGIVKLLIDRGVAKESMNIFDHDGFTALSEAAANGHEGIVKLLLEHGDDTASVDLPNRRGFRTLSLAASGGYEGIVKLLIDSGASVDLATDKLWTALSLAVRNDHESVVRLLLDSGVAKQSIDLPNCYGQTALSLAAENGNGVIYSLLIDSGACVDERSWTDIEGLEEAIKRLFEDNAD